MDDIHSIIGIEIPLLIIVQQTNNFINKKSFIFHNVLLKPVMNFDNQMSRAQTMSLI